MATIILTTDKFKPKGKYHIPDAGGAYSNGAVQECIDMFEKDYIYKLLGVTLGDLFIAWIQNVAPPVNADYTKIKDPFDQDITTGSGEKVHSLGMEKFLMAMINFEFIRNPIINSMVGMVIPKTEGAEVVRPSTALRLAESKFNEMLRTVEAIHWYVLLNPTAFPDFNGECFKPKGSFIL